MNKARSLVELGAFYENNIIEEKKAVFPPKGTFKVASDKKPVEAKADKNAFLPKNSGPENADNFKKDMVDPETAKNDNFYEPKKFSQNYEKTEVQTINNFMSKSIFDKLYEDVMSDQFNADTKDAEALGLPSSDAGESAGGEEEVTFTLPRDAAQKLHDVLAAVLTAEEDKAESDTEEVGGEEAGVEGGEEANEEKDADDKAGKDEDAENVAKEATELKELPDSAGQGLQKKDNKVGDTTKSLVSHGAGDGKVTDKCGNDGEKGHALVGSGVKGGASTSPKGKANVVSSKTSKVGSYLAGLK
jgi:hypothetical protein